MNLKKQREILELFKSGDYYCTRDGFVISMKFGYPSICKVRRTPTGYLMVTVMSRRKLLTACVHQFVALYFFGQYNSNRQVNHKNAIKADNRICNLEIVTPSENALHASRMGLRADQRGEKNGGSRLTNRDIREIRKRAKKGELQYKLAKEFGIGAGALSLIVLRKTWAHI